MRNGKYFGQYSDSETNLSYLNARYYDPDRGQFLTIDPVVLHIGIGGGLESLALLTDPQRLNSYLYARGNPIGFVDPQGSTPAIPASSYAPSYWQCLQLANYNPALAMFYYMTFQSIANDIEIISNPEESLKSRVLAGIFLGLDLLPGGTAKKGVWVTTNEVMSGAAAAYQTFISRTSFAISYLLNGVKFDGLLGGVLLEAKSGMLNFVDVSTGTFKTWFKDSGGKSLLEQARRQVEAANGQKIEWHFQYKEVRDAVSNWFRENNIEGIDLIYSPD